MIYVFDTREQLKAIMSNENPNACPYWGDRIRLRLPNGVHLFEFECPADHASAQYLQIESYVAVKDLDGKLILFRVRETEDMRRADGSMIKRIYAESAALELLTDIVRPINLGAVTATQALGTILTGSQWQPGIIEWASVADVKFDVHISVLAAIHEVRAKFGGDLRFRVEFDGVRIIGKYVDFVQNLGANNGQRFEYGKDMLGILRTENSDELVTALIGVGKTDADGNTTNFKNIEWTSPSKPLNQDWIGDPEALSTWGKRGKHKFGIFEYDTDNPQTLLNETWKALQKRKIPKLTYELDAILLERISGGSFQNDKKRLGDTIVIKDSSFVPAILVEARIIEMEIHMTDPSLDRVVLGNFVELDPSTDSYVLKQLQTLVNQKKASWDQPGETIFKGSAAPPEPKIDQLWLDTATNPNVLKRWTGEMWVKATPTQPSEVGAEKEVPKQPTPPQNPQPGDQWIDTSDPMNPPVQRVWNDFLQEWEKMTRTALEEMQGQISDVQIKESAIKETHIDAGAISEAKMKWSTHLIF